MLSFEELIDYLKTNHNISVAANQKRNLRNIGYYHGYKGYRFIRYSSHQIPFSSMKEITTLNKFDLDLKSLFYPKLMYIETALKSYFIESLIKDANSEEMSVIYSKTITNYKRFTKGSKAYKDEFKKRMNLQMKINSALIRDYQKGNDIEKYYFDNDKTIPIWAIFESLSLGEFGNLFDCSNLSARIYTSKMLQLPTNLDADGSLLSSIIYTIRDLRNAVAHNGVIFDTRFKTSRINSRLLTLLEKETGIDKIDFKYISSYVILVSYLYKKLGMTYKECSGFVHEYNRVCAFLFQNIDRNICFEIVGTDSKSKMEKLEEFLKSDR